MPCNGLREPSRKQLQRRGAFEHVMADISTSLIDAQPHEIDARQHEAIDHVNRPKAHLLSV
jgi:hypothetical protein